MRILEKELTELRYRVLHEWPGVQPEIGLCKSRQLAALILEVAAHGGGGYSPSISVNVCCESLSIFGLNARIVAR